MEGAGEKRTRTGFWGLADTNGAGLGLELYIPCADRVDEGKARTNGHFTDFCFLFNSSKSRGKGAPKKKRTAEVAKKGGKKR